VEKTITLEDDPIFRRAAHYNDKMNYPVTPPLEQRAAAVRDIILESVMLGRLDKTDLRIIAARDCSPMPNTRAVARQLHIPRRTVRRRMARIQSLITQVFSADSRR